MTATPQDFLPAQMNSPANRIWIVGDFPTQQDVKSNRWLSGASFSLYRDQMAQAGLDPYKVCAFAIMPKPPKYRDLKHWFLNKSNPRGVPFEDGYYEQSTIDRWLRCRELIKRCRPKLVYLLGEVALKAVLGESGITAWRGSMIFKDGTLFIPTFSFNQVMSNFPWRFFQRQDFTRGAKYVRGELPSPPQENFTPAPTFEEASNVLSMLEAKAEAGTLELAVDIEGRNEITCIGIAWSDTDAICFPFRCEAPKRNYWDTLEQELEVIWRLSRLLTHPSVLCSGHNFDYDRSHLLKLWGIKPRLGMDTMQAWHCCFPALPQSKSLASVCSFLLPWYRNWKGEAADHNPVTAEEFQSYWIYNCRDCVRTFAAKQELEKLIDDLEIREQYEEQRRLMRPAFLASSRGIRQNVNLRSQMTFPIIEAQMQYSQFFNYFTEPLTGGAQLTKAKKASPWWNSPTQLNTILYEIHGLPVQTNKKTHRPSTDDECLSAIAASQPIFAPLIEAILHYRSLGVFLSTFLQANLHPKTKRFHFRFGVGLASTFRWTSSKDNFGRGGNIQNIPKGDEK